MMDELEINVYDIFVIYVYDIDEKTWRAGHEITMMFSDRDNIEKAIAIFRCYAEKTSQCLYLKVSGGVDDEACSYASRIFWAEYPEKNVYGDFHFYLNSKVLPDIPQTREMKKREYVSWDILGYKA